MHFMRGLNIGKKIFKILGKQMKFKIKPFHAFPNETEFYRPDLVVDENFMNFHLRHSLMRGSNSIQLKEDFKRNDFIKNLMKHVTVSTQQLFFLYIVMKNKNMKMTEEKKNVTLGCSLKINDTGEKKGMKIVAIKEESAAENANLLVNDVILKIDEHEVNNIEQFNAIWNKGDALKKSINVLRKENDVYKLCEIEVNLNEEVY